MIPIQLTIKGLYSYQEKQTIDFTKLTAAHLFGIFGTVGSGKSSILEAVTFAIYGKTDRLNLSGDNRNYNMMNLKSDELLIDFVFEAGKEQLAYKAVVRGRRNSKRFEDVKKLDRKAYRKQDDEWLPIETSELERAVGLSYDNFKRTIIIPQGQFQEFLQLGNKERTQMMKELFGLEKYELYYKVAALEGKNNAKKQNLEGQLQQLGEIDPKQVKQYEQQLGQLKKELFALSEKLKDAQKKEGEWKQLKDLTKKQADSGKQLKDLQEKEPGYKKLEKLVATYELCVLKFKHLLDSLQTSTKRQEQKEKQIGQDSDKLAGYKKEIEKLDKLLEKLKPAYEKREGLKQRARELTLLLKIRQLGSKINEKQGRLKKGNEIWEETQRNVERLKEEKSKLEEQLKVEKAKVPDMTMLSNIKAWHVENDNLQKQLLDYEKQVQKYLGEENKTRQALNVLLKNVEFDGLPEEAGLPATEKLLNDKIDSIKKELKQAETEANEFQIKTRLQDFADSLSDGKPCPLCGSQHHPQVYNAENSKEAQQKLQKYCEGKEKQIEQINHLIAQVKERYNQLKYDCNNREEWNKKKNYVSSKIKEHSETFKWEDFRIKDALEKAFNDAGVLQLSVKKKEEKLADLTKGLDKKLKDKERFQSELEKIKTDVAVSETELKTLSSQLKLVTLESYHEKKKEEIEAERKKLFNNYEELEKQFSLQSNLLKEQQKLQDVLSGSLTVNKKELEEEKENNVKLKKSLDGQLANTQFESLEEVQIVLSQEINLEQEKQKLTVFKEQLSLTKKQVDQLTKEVGDRVYEAGKHNALREEIEKQKQLSNEKNQELGKQTELLQKLQKDLENQAALRKELDALNLRGENIKTMKSLFKASGFVNFISSVYLQNLCNAANDRFFQLTRQKLSLEITPDNNFHVRDFLNGGKVRSVKTLSGGQTFQAALSLALALADNVQKITDSNQNFFFLDEGFGSLDKESLAVVFDTLKSLRKENRIVGVISHVEEMQQEIDVHLRIENQEEEGSRILSSWSIG